MTQAVDLVGTPHIPPTTLPSLTQSDPLEKVSDHCEEAGDIWSPDPRVPPSTHCSPSEQSCEAPRTWPLTPERLPGLLRKSSSLPPAPPPGDLDPWSRQCLEDSPLPLHLPAARKWCRNRLEVLSIYQNVLSFLFMGERSRAWFH